MHHINRAGTALTAPPRHEEAQLPMQDGSSQTDPRKRHRTKRRGVFFRLGPDGRKSYCVSYRDSTGKQRWQNIDGGIREAEAVLDDLKSRMRRGERVLPSNVTLHEYAATWLDAQSHLRPRTRDAYSWALDHHVLPALGAFKLSAITEEDAVALMGAMQDKGYAGSTIQAAVLPLSRILSHAARRGLIPMNPLLRLERGERPQRNRAEQRHLDQGELARLLDATKDASMRTLIALSATTGLRQGEALGLRWQDVDLTNRVLHVRFQLGRDGTLAPPKTARGTREVDLGAQIVSALREHKLASPHTRPIDYVFSSVAGSHLHYRAVVRALDGAAKRAKLNEDGRPKLHWHSLRHTAAALWIGSQAEAEYVSRQLGHANSTITRNVYGHVFDRTMQAARVRDAQDAALGNNWVTPGGNQWENEPPGEAAKMAQLREIGASGN
jgi:integrase